MEDNSISDEGKENDDNGGDDDAASTLSAGADDDDNGAGSEVEEGNDEMSDVEDNSDNDQPTGDDALLYKDEGLDCDDGTNLHGPQDNDGKGANNVGEGGSLAEGSASAAEDKADAASRCASSQYSTGTYIWWKARTVQEGTKEGDTGGNGRLSGRGIAGGGSARRDDIQTLVTMSLRDSCRLPYCTAAHTSASAKRCD